MSKIPTAKEFLKAGNYLDWHPEHMEKAIEFAKLHVKAALEAANNSMNTHIQPHCDDHTPYWGVCSTCGSYNNWNEIKNIDGVNKSILNSYPESNIQ
jgi:hypothetical protein